MDVTGTMDVTGLMNSMKMISENLLVVPTDDCSDEFLAALDELIKKATDIALRIKNGKINRQQRVSTSSEDVTCIIDIETIDVDSEGDNSGNVVNVSIPSGKMISTENANNVSISSSKSQLTTPTMSTTQSMPSKRKVRPAVILKRFDVNDVSRILGQKRCVVKLHRISAAEILRINGLDPNVMAVNADIAGALAHAKPVAGTKRLRRGTRYPRKLSNA